MISEMVGVVLLLELDSMDIMRILCWIVVYVSLQFIRFNYYLINVMMVCKCVIKGSVPLDLERRA